MLNLIFGIVFALGVALFAVQNGELVLLRIGNFTSPTVPVYAVALAFLLLGLLFAGILGLLDSLIASFKIFRRDKALASKDQSVTSLQKRVRELELENKQLQDRDRTSPLN